MFESEEWWVVERIKDFAKSKNFSEYFYIMLRNGRILYTGNYFDMVKADKINPQDAYVYFELEWASSSAGFHYPFLVWNNVLLSAYLSKLGFWYLPFVVSATGLRYVTRALYYKGYLSVEVSNLDTVVNNTNLRNIMFKVLGDKIISEEKELIDEEYDKILGMFSSQQLFAGYTPGKAWEIIRDYYNKGNKSLIKEVARITFDYERIFQPYRACYDMGSWDEVDCLSIKLD